MARQRTLTTTETCAALRTGRNTVARLIQTGELSSVKAGPHRTAASLIRVASIQAYIQRHTVNGGQVAMADEIPRLYTLPEVAEQTGFALRTLQRDCRANRITHVHRGRARLMTAEQILALVRAATSEAEPDLETIVHAASQARARQQLDRILAREASRRVPRRA